MRRQAVLLPISNQLLEFAESQEIQHSLHPNLEEGQVALG